MRHHHSKTATRNVIERLVVIFLITIYISTSLKAQDYQWAFSTAKAPRTQTIAIRQDNGGGFYLATYTDSVSTRIYTQLEKRGANQQLVWLKQINGKATITDFEINSQQHPVVVGYFTGSINIDGAVLTSIASKNSSFIFECDELGNIQWVKEINPLNNGFKTQDLFIAKNGLMYLTSQTTGGTAGLSAFHKLDATGNILKNEFTTTLENNYFSHIIADSIGNVYLTGTCGNFAKFDTINSNPNYSYQNFFVKYDSSFKAKLLISKNYITFDNNNKLTTDGKYLYWVFDDFGLGGSSNDSVKIIKLNFNGQIVSTVIAPFAAAFFPAIDYSMDKSGNSTFILLIGSSQYLYRFDTLFNIVWQDTLLTKISGFPFNSGLICYDSCFYISSIYQGPSLAINHFLLQNPNVGMNYVSDVFVSKWSSNTILPLIFTSFSALQKNENILLQWTTYNEINTSQFIIEKSKDGIHFEKIGSIKSKNAKSNIYDFLDETKNEHHTIIYYRLKQIDNNGDYKYSKIIAVKQALLSAISIAPNPASSYISLQINTEQTQSVEIKILNAAGKIVAFQKQSLHKGNNSISLNINNLANGYYTLIVEGNLLQVSKQFVKH